MFFDKLRPLYFLLAFGIGLLFCYMTNPKPQVVVKFPSPYNAGQVIYKDSNESCYKYNASKVECPRDKALIKEQPIQEDFRPTRYKSSFSQRNKEDDEPLNTK